MELIMRCLQKPLSQTIPKFTFLVLKENFLITTPKEQHIVWNSQDDSQVCGHLKIGSVQFSSVQSLSRVRLFATPWIAACQPSLSITISQSSLRLTSIESVMPSSHLILGRPLLLLPSISPSWSFTYFYSEDKSY